MFFIDLAKTRLPSRMGQKYTDIVVTCLTCLENPGFGGQSDLDDRDGTVIGTRFIKQVENVPHLCRIIIVYLLSGSVGTSRNIFIKQVKAGRSRYQTKRVCVGSLEERKHGRLN